MTNSALVEISADKVPDLLGQAIVVDAFPVGGVRTSENYDGAQRAAALNRSDFDADGAIGGQGNRKDDLEIKIGIVEFWDGTPYDNRIFRTHEGWEDWSNGPSRVEQVYDCNPNCVTTSANAISNTHGTRVAAVAAASIEQGQDPAYPGSMTQAQLQRSGVAREAQIFYYRTTTDPSVVDAIQEAMHAGVDVLNMSFTWINEVCDPATNISNLNEVFSQALSAGMILVGAAGNLSSPQSGCTMRYPSYRPEVIGVSGLDTQSDPAYSNTELASGSRIGPVPIIVGAIGRTTSGPFAAAPHFVSHVLGYPGGYVSTSGTSYASPFVAGTIGLLRDALDRNNWGYSADVGGRLVAAAGLLGDRWIGPAATTRSNNATGHRAGFGRFRGHFSDGVSLSSPWNWRMGNFTVTASSTDVMTYSLPSGTTQFKMVIAWFDDDMQDASDIVLRVKNTCPSGGGTSTLGSDMSFNLRKRVSFTHPSSACLSLETTAYHIPNGESRIVYYAYYHHGNNLDEH